MWCSVCLALGSDAGQAVDAAGRRRAVLLALIGLLLGVAGLLLFTPADLATALWAAAVLTVEQAALAQLHRHGR